MKPLVQGVGINEGTYPTRVNGNIVKEYSFALSGSDIIKEWLDFLRLFSKRELIVQEN